MGPIRMCSCNPWERVYRRVSVSMFWRYQIEESSSRVEGVGERGFLDMMKKSSHTPFRTPFLNKTDDHNDSQPLPKKRRISIDRELGTTRTTPRLVFKTPGISSLPRKPLSAVRNPAVAAELAESGNGGSDSHFNVLWYSLILVGSLRQTE